ncbi:hypothetical protein VNO78_30459 [Psophocarpus tetragonolobus]|uniref:Uncharacterized protein n=1 Tax=Psophocarpus tetragonolobus TaxID=3891 RepID=A0AAN9RWL1_PSOTE
METRSWTLGWVDQSTSGVHQSARPFCWRCVPGLNWPGRASGAVTLKKLETPLGPYEKSKSLGSGRSMVARLKLKGIDGRALPGGEPAAEFDSTRGNLPIGGAICLVNSVNERDLGRNLSGCHTSLPSLIYIYMKMSRKAAVLCWEGVCWPPVIVVSRLVENRVRGRVRAMIIWWMSTARDQSRACICRSQVRRVWRSILSGGPGPSPLEEDTREGESPVVPGPCRTTRRCRRVGLFGNAAPIGK